MTGPDSRFHLAALFFLAFFSFSYVFSGIAGVNVPRYYPTLGAWSAEGIAGAPSMGYYGKVALVLPVALAAAAAFWLAFPALSRRRQLRTGYFSGAAAASLAWAILFFVGEEGHEWIVDKGGLAGGGFLNAELGLFALLAAAFAALLFLGPGLEGRER